MRTHAQTSKETSASPTAESTISGSGLKGQSSAVNSIFRLQRTAGNRAAQMLLRSAVSPLADPLEEEADRVADAVMGIRDSVAIHPPRRSAVAAAIPQRCACATAEEETCESCRRNAPAIQRSATGAAPSKVPARLAMGDGAPLPESTRTLMEERFGADFSDVRIHTGEEAAVAARNVSAHAFTIGSDIAFARNAFRPSGNGGQRLLAHELAHVLQQRRGGLRVQRFPDPPTGQTTPGGGVTGVRISCADNRVVFDAGSGSHSYALTSCNIPVGTYTAGVSIRGATIDFDFGEAVEGAEEFTFGFRIDPGQANPLTLFAGQSQVTVSVVEHLPDVLASSLQSRVSAFQRLVKNAGKLRLADNSRALDQWSGFLQQQLTPSQVATQVHTEEVRSLLERAYRGGGAEIALAEQWLQTPGPNRRWVLEQQIEGRYRACTGCHATVQAQALDYGLQEQRGHLATPLEQLPSGPDTGPRPSFAEGEQLPPTAHGGLFPRVAEAQQRINAIQPYLRLLGPAGYRVLPPETLGSTATPVSLLTDISIRIAQRQADYQEFSRRIDDPDFDYLQLRPIVRDLLPLADPDVREAVESAIASAETWETIKSIAVGAATIGLLILTIFPPTSALGIAGALALGGAVASYQVYQGIQGYELGRLYSLGRGAHDVLDPAQQEAADSLMAIGALNIILGSVGVASTALGAVRILRAAVPPGGGALGAVEGVEGTAGGNLYRVTGWGSRDPHVVVTNPSGQVIREGPLSSFRAGTSAGPQASAGGGGFTYPTQGGAALQAQPVPQPVIAPVARPAIAPVTAPPTVPPGLRGALGTTGAASALRIVAATNALGQRQPVMPANLSPADQDLWRRCNQQHNTYKATQDEAAAYAATMDPIRNRIMQNQATAQDRLDFCRLLDERIRLVQRLHSERSRYIRMDCDRFDWFNTGTTAAERLTQHQIELDNVAAQLRNFYDLRNRFCP